MRLTSSDEQAILQVTKRLISQLEMHKLDPRMVTAEKRIKLDPRIYKSSVALPFSLWDKLSPDEWRPLIASRLIYERNFTKKKMAINFSYMLFPYWMLFPFLAISQILGIIPQPEPVASGLILLWVLAMIPIAKVVYTPFFRKLHQTADSQSLELAMVPSLEDVLRKIDTMHIQKPRASKALERRIKNLHQT